MLSADLMRECEATHGGERRVKSRPGPRDDHDNDWHSEGPPGRPPPRPGRAAPGSQAGRWGSWGSPDPLGGSGARSREGRRVVPILVGPTFLAPGPSNEYGLPAAGLGPDLRELPRPCPPGQLVPGTQLGRDAPGCPAGGDLASGPARRPLVCAWCQGPVDRTAVDLVHVLGSSWHRQCWIVSARGREQALRSQREHVGRKLALAGYLVAQEQWGGLPAVQLGANLVAPNGDLAVDND